MLGRLRDIVVFASVLLCCSSDCTGNLSALSVNLNDSHKPVIKPFLELEMSQVRQNYSSDVEKGVNDQINMELYAFYTYLSMVSARNARVWLQAYIEFCTIGM